MHRHRVGFLTRHETRPLVHQRPALGYKVRSRIGLFHRRPHRVRQAQLHHGVRRVGALRRPIPERRPEAMHGRPFGKAGRPQHLGQRHVGHRLAPLRGRREDQPRAITNLIRLLQHRERRIRQRDTMLDTTLHAFRRNAPLARGLVDLIPGRTARLARTRCRQDQEAKTQLRRERRIRRVHRRQRLRHFLIGQGAMMRLQAWHRRKGAVQRFASSVAGAIVVRLAPSKNGANALPDAPGRFRPNAPYGL